MKRILLFFLILLLGSFRQEAAVKVLGFYSNEKSVDGEHSKGYFLSLWKYGDGIIGVVSYNQGLIGDAISEVISEVRYNKANGNFSFTSGLDGNMVSFTGKLLPAKVTGTFTQGKRADKAQTLSSCCKDAFIYKNYKTYEDWKSMVQKLKSNEL